MRWVLAMAKKLSPLADALNRYILSAGKAHADDTMVQPPTPFDPRPRIYRRPEKLSRSEQGVTAISH